MNQRISIIGSGWLGFELGQTLAKHGNSIKISTTTSDKKASIQSAGLKPFLIDLNDLKNDMSEFLESEILILVTGVKNIDSYQKLIARIEKSPIQKVMFISSTSVYPNTNGTVTEASPVNDSPLVHIETLFRKDTRFETSIVRFGGLFGYDRKPGNFFRQGKTIQNPEGQINLIHRDDCIAILTQIIEKNLWNETFNACADTHPTRRAFYTQQIKKMGRELPPINEDSPNEYKIVSSEKIKSFLNYQFKYADLMAYRD